MRAKDVLGRLGEEAAARHLAGLGWTIIDRNWRCPEGELDIVARDGANLVVCEVKTRSGLVYGAPVEAATPAVTVLAFVASVSVATAARRPPAEP